MRFLFAVLLALVAGCQPKMDPQINKIAAENVWEMRSLASRCTSFQVDKDLIVSAGHCAESVIHVFGNGKDILPGELIGVSKYSDVSLFFVPGADRPGIDIARDPVVEGATFMAGGYPARVGKFAFMPVKIISIDKDDAGGVYGHSLGQSIWPGMSGGPLLNENGEVVGVISSISQTIFGNPADPTSLEREVCNYALDLRHVIEDIINDASSSILGEHQE